MIRIIVRTDDSTMAAHVNGPLHTTYRTFEVDLPEVEAALADGPNDNGLVQRSILGVEIVDR